MTEQRPEDERLDPEVPQVGPEFETFEEATEATQWPMVPVLVRADLVEDPVAWQMEWRRTITTMGRRPMGEAGLAHRRYADVEVEGLFLYPADDEREGWFAYGPVDAVPPGIGAER